MSMPLDNQFDNWWENERWRKRATWNLEFALLPKRCAITNKRIWLKWYYRGEAMITGPGEPVYLDRHHDRHEHLLWALAG